jgi:hypothetical protein
MGRPEKEKRGGILMRLEQLICKPWYNLRVIFTPKEPGLPSQELHLQAESSAEKVAVLAITYSKPLHHALERAAVKQGWVLLWAESWGEAFASWKITRPESFFWTGDCSVWIGGMRCKCCCSLLIGAV